MKDTGKVLIKGKEYETVASRVQRFRETYHEDLSIVTEIVDRDNESVVMKASIYKGVQVIATGYAEENRNSSTINKTSALENCETSAIGRALAAFGMAGSEYASADEVAQAIVQQATTTVQKAFKQEAPKPKMKLTGMATDKQRAIIESHLSRSGVTLENQPGHLIEHYGVEVPLTKEGASFVIDELFSKKV
jgi:hypothetical protein